MGLMFLSHFGAVQSHPLWQLEGVGESQSKQPISTEGVQKLWPLPEWIYYLSQFHSFEKYIWNPRGISRKDFETQVKWSVDFLKVRFLLWGVL